MYIYNTVRQIPNWLILIHSHRFNYPKLFIFKRKKKIVRSLVLVILLCSTVSRCIIGYVYFQRAPAAFKACCLFINQIWIWKAIEQTLKVGLCRCYHHCQYSFIPASILCILCDSKSKITADTALYYSLHVYNTCIVYE